MHRLTQAATSKSEAEPPAAGLGRTGGDGAVDELKPSGINRNPRGTTTSAAYMAMNIRVATGIDAQR